MRRILSLGLSLAVVVVLAFSARADDKKDEKKEVTLKGTIVCGKCELGVTDDCSNAIKVKEDGKDVVYFLIDSGKKEKYHGDICSAPKKGSVVGVTSTKDKKNYITPAKDGVKFE